MEPTITNMATLAARFVNSTDRHVFLTGKAGTGKTTFLRRLAEQTHKRFVILAPTGIAALNAGGVTLHSQFLLPLGAFIPERNAPEEIMALGHFVDREHLTRKHPLNGLRRNVLREADLLIIDEVSMLRADVLDAVDHRMRTVKGRHDRAFGGAQVLLIGDLYQLPPVVKDHEWEVLRRYYRSAHFFEAHAMRPYEDGSASFVHIELDKVFRQQDEDFIRILNNFRANTVTAGDVERLNVHHRAEVLPGDEGTITLTTHNNKAEGLNREALERLPGPSNFFTASVDGDFPESMYPLPETLELRVGARVMFTRNDPERTYFNGKLAVVTRLEKEDVEVALDAADGGSPMPYMLRKVRWENKRYRVLPDTKELIEEVIGTFDQYPVKLAWAITVHKSQGLTFNKAIIDVGQAFAPGQVYVALSRLRSLDGLVLRTRINPGVVSSDADVVAFTARRPEPAVLPDLLAVDQRGYLQEVIMRTFHFEPVQRAAQRMLEEHGAAFFADTEIRQALVDLVEEMRKEAPNTAKFRAQLMRLVGTGERDALLERMEKGALYYSAVLFAHVKRTVRNTAVLARLTGTQAYREDLDEVDAALMKKLLEIAKAGHIVRSMLTGEEVVRDGAAEKRVKDQRQVILEQVAAYMAEHHPAGKGKSGRVRKKKAVADGEGKPQKGDSYKLSCNLFAEGLSVEEIAKQRGLTPTTIESHLAPGIRSGQVDITRLMPDDVRDAIAAWMKDHPEGSTKDVHVHFHGAHSYGRIRMVQAWVQHAELNA